MLHHTLCTMWVLPSPKAVQHEYCQLQDESKAAVAQDILHHIPHMLYMGLLNQMHVTVGAFFRSTGMSNTTWVSDVTIMGKLTVSGTVYNKR